MIFRSTHCLNNPDLKQQQQTKMTPAQKLKLAILFKAKTFDDSIRLDAAALSIDGALVDKVYDELDEQDLLQDARNEIREGQVETELETDYSRHFEAKAVAMKTTDGSWVGWTFWFGGGKHAEPEAIEWIDEAYDLDCKEEEKTVTVQTFTKVILLKH